MPSHVAVVWRCYRWRQTSMTSREKLPPYFAESGSNIIKYVFKGYELSEIERNIYNYIIKGLSHWNRWILSLVGITMDARKLASFHIPTRDNIHRYQCNNPILWYARHSIIWAAPSEFGTYRLCEKRIFRRACASAQSRQNLRCSLIQAVSQEDPSDRKPDPWPLWMARHAQLIFVMTECSKTQICLTRPIYCQCALCAKLVLLAADNQIREKYPVDSRSLLLSEQMNIKYRFDSQDKI